VSNDRAINQWVEQHKGSESRPDMFRSATNLAAEFQNDSRQLQSLKGGMVDGVESFRDILDKKDVKYADLSGAFRQASMDFGRANIEMYLNSAPGNKTGIDAFMTDAEGNQMDQRTWGTDQKYLIVRGHDQAGSERFFVYEKKPDNGFGLTNDPYLATSLRDPAGNQEKDRIRTNIAEAGMNEYVRPGGPAGTHAENSDGVVQQREVQPAARVAYNPAQP
jgi:hypothetical protein